MSDRYGPREVRWSASRFTGGTIGSGPLSAATLSRRRFLAGITAGAGALAVGVWWLGDTHAGPRMLLLVVEKTSRSPGGLSPEFRDRVHQLAAGPGVVVLTVVVGERVERLAPVVLSTSREGEPEHDPARLTASVDARLAELTQRCAEVQVGASGFALAAALRGIDLELRTRGPLEVWLQTAVVTGTADPLDVHTLLAADPDPAAQAVLGTSVSTLQLAGAEIHPVLVDPVGADQPPLSLHAQRWRADFIAGITTGLGARVLTPVSSQFTASAWPNGSVVPVVNTEEDPTPALRYPPIHGEVPLAVDTAAFVPNTAILLVPAAVFPTLAAVRARYLAAGSGHVIECAGYCAAYGPAAGARALSAARAELLGQLLVTEHGVPAGDVRSVGRGFDERADSAQDSRSPAQRVVLIRVLPRR